MRLLAAVLALCSAMLPAADFSGASALEFARKAVSFGPRPPASAANKNLEVYLRAQIKLRGGQFIDDPFTAKTPLGPMQMRNVIARFPGSSGRALVFTGHFDTKLFPGRHFVGANDGGSSTGLLLELMHALSSGEHKDDIYFVWFDGEEALGEWSETDGIHGSRHLAERWSIDGTLPRIRALINVDMIGDKDLGFFQETNSTPWLRKLVWQAANEKGYGKYFKDYRGAIEDDHMPFLRRGVPALDLIDFEYGPNNSYWHTDQDTMDKLSAHSFQVVGDVLMDVVRRLNSQ